VGRPFRAADPPSAGSTRQQLEFVNLTEAVEELVGECDIRDGMALVQNTAFHHGHLSQRMAGCSAR
jgi:hypothetical protein